MRKDSLGVYRSPLLEEFSWLEHGFGTRNSRNWPDGRPVSTLRQIHSAIVVDAPAGDRGREGDALVTGRPGDWIGVRTADCYPLILADPVRRAAAVVHAGWRGTAAGIVFRAVEALAGRYGSQPVDLAVAVGPGIGGCCYEVGQEVASQFYRDAAGRRKLDLAAVLVGQLQQAGVRTSRVEVAGLCTFCRREEFYSYRREGSAAGRMITAAGVLPE